MVDAQPSIFASPPSKAVRDFYDKFVETDGQASYDGLVAAAGKVNKKEFLVLPDDFVIPRVVAADVGNASAHTNITSGQWLQIYVLNKSACLDPAYAVKFALLRSEAVRCGWLRDGDTYEIVRQHAPANPASRMAPIEFDAIKQYMELARTAAFILPMVAEHTFRTMGHHYSTNDASLYIKHYSAILRACFLPEVAIFLPPAMLYHSVLHWVNYARARDVLGAQLIATSVPSVLRILYNTAPVGTEIITSTDAVIKSLQKAGLGTYFGIYGGFGLHLISCMSTTIKQDPPKYHEAYFAYGRPDLCQNEKRDLERAKEEAIRFAPYSHAFITTHLHQADLDKTKVLAKHAMQNPFALRRVESLFRRLGSDECKSFEGLIRAEFERG